MRVWSRMRVLIHVSVCLCVYVRASFRVGCLRSTAESNQAAYSIILKKKKLISQERVSFVCEMVIGNLKPYSSRRFGSANAHRSIRFIHKRTDTQIMKKVLRLKYTHIRPSDFRFHFYFRVIILKTWIRENVWNRLLINEFQSFHKNRHGANSRHSVCFLLSNVWCRHFVFVAGWFIIHIRCKSDI